MQIDREKLIEKLNIAKKAIKNNTMSPILGCYCFTGTDLITFDGIKAIVQPFNTEFIGGLPASLLPILQKYKKDTIQFSEIDKKTMRLSCGRSKIDFSSAPKDCFLFEKEQQKKAELSIVLGTKILQVLAQMRPILDKDGTHINAHGLYLEKKERKLIISGTTNRIIGEKRMNTRLKDTFKVFIPSDILSILDIFQNKDLKLELFEQNMIFYCADIELICPTINQNDFLDVKELLHKQKDSCSEKIKLPEDFEDLLTRVDLLFSDSIKPVFLTFSENILTIKASTNSGKIEEAVKIEYNGPDKQIEVSLTDLLIIFQNKLVEDLSFCENGLLFSGANVQYLTSFIGR